MGDHLATIDMGRKLGAVAPFWGGELGPIQHNVAWDEAYIRIKWRVDPSSRLATIHQLHIQDRQTDRQRSDSIGRIVLQTVAEKETALRNDVGLPTRLRDYQDIHVATHYDHKSPG